MFETKKLLVVSHTYNNFQKEPIDIIANNFKKVSVLVRYNPIAQISKYIPYTGLERFQLGSNINLINKPKNVEVFPTPVYYVPLDFEYKQIGERHFKSAEKTIKRNHLKFDLIHSHFTWSSGYVGAKLKEKYDVPFAITAHGYDIYDLPFRDQEWKEKIKYVLNTTDYIITVSESNLKCINQLNIKTPVKVIPNGFNEKLFYPRDLKNCRNTLNLPLDKKIILSVGNLVEIKGHKYLIDAIGEVVKHRKDILCIIIGSGELKNKLHKQIKNAVLEKYIMFAGGRQHNEIPIWMNTCDVFVLPSLNEGNPTVMFECLGCGRPFVGTRVGGVPEIITSEEYGLLCEPANPEELAKNILIALDKEWNVKKIEEYSAQFTWNAISKEILNVYSKLDY